MSETPNLVRPHWTSTIFEKARDIRRQKLFERESQRHRPMTVTRPSEHSVTSSTPRVTPSEGGPASTTVPHALEATPALATSLPSQSPQSNATPTAARLSPPPAIGSLTGSLAVHTSSDSTMQAATDFTSQLQTHLPSRPAKLPVRRTCNVCDSEVPASSFPVRNGHNHRRQTCKPCTRDWIKGQLDSGVTGDRIACSECPKLLTLAEIQAISGKRIFAQYGSDIDQAMTRAILAADPNFRYCLSTSCTSGQVHLLGGDEPIFVCHACGHRHCTVCNQNWHEGALCPEAAAAQAERERLQANTDTTKTTQAALGWTVRDPSVDGSREQAADTSDSIGQGWTQFLQAQQEELRRLSATREAEEKVVREAAELAAKEAAERAEREERARQNAASESAVATISKTCPKCGIAIQKNMGCDHMTCTHCQRHFCWLCKANYREIFRVGNHAHRPTCAHYRALVPLPTTVPRPAHR